MAAIFSNRLPIPSAAIQEMRLDVQRRIRAQISRSQFLHSDYLGIINDFNQEITDVIPTIIMDIVVRTQYRFVADVVFRSLHESKCSFERIGTDQFTEDILHGEAQFSLAEQRQQLPYSEKEKLNSSPFNMSKESLPTTQK